MEIDDWQRDSARDLYFTAEDDEVEAAEAAAVKAAKDSNN
jgi:hypothetical protein